MLSLIANGIEKQLKDEFIDVTLNELAAAYQYIGSLSAEMKRYLLTASEAEIDEEKVIEYKIHWISLFSDLTKDELKLVPTDAVIGLSIDWLYNHCEQFLHQPISYREFDYFEHNNIKYNLLESTNTIGGAKMLFSKGTFRQFMLGSQLTSAVSEHKNNRGIQSLKQLFALLYSDGDDSSEGIIKRSEIFGEVNALYGWSAYFYFLAVGKEVERIYRLIYDKEPTSAKDSKSIKETTAKTITIKNHFWEIVAIKVAEQGVFNIEGITPLEAVMNKRAFDVLKVFNLNLTQ